MATHGFVDEEKPELSGILFAQSFEGQKETPITEEDGILFSGEIYNLDLNADLVVLSACETGLGKIHKGEGVIGLTYSLKNAGAKNIMVSLWKVADMSTADLMIDFYEHILNDGKKDYSAAIRQAKLNMINRNDFSHPFY